MKTGRRNFLQAAACGGVLPLIGLPVVAAEDAMLPRGAAGAGGGVDALVKLIEDSPRDEVLARLAARIHDGASFREVLAGLMLAAVRNVRPYPSVGFKFHCVLVVHSCHQASLDGPDADRWLPIFWAVDYFKRSQADQARRDGWTMKPVDEARVPRTAAAARASFVDAMERWDPEQADVATAGVVRELGADEVFGLFARYAARDYRSIGHKAIFLANGWRTLEAIGWRHAEPVLRSLAAALLNHEGDPDPATSDLPVDRPWRTHDGRLHGIAGEQVRTDQPDVAAELFAPFRQADTQGAATLAADLLRRGVSARTVWDGVFVGAGELLMRQPGIVALHGITTANAVRYLWGQTADADLRHRLLLQACSFNAFFRDSAGDRGDLAGATVVDLPQPQQVPGDLPAVMAAISDDPHAAAAGVRRFLADGGSAGVFVDAARRVLFRKGDDPHAYKFAVAALEDYRHVGPQWRDLFLSLSVYSLKGSGDADSPLVARTRAAFG